MPRRLRCEKANCPAEGAVLVTLEAADGSFAWWACPDHAEAFKAWVSQESDRQGAAWGSVEMWARPTIEWMNP